MVPLGALSKAHYEFENLHAVRGRAFAQLVAHDPHLKRRGAAARAEARYVDGVGVFDLARRNDALAMVHDPGRALEGGGQILDARGPFGFKKYRFGVRGSYGDADAQRIDAQVRKLQNLARLLAHFKFFAGFAGAVERADLRDDVVHDRAFAAIELLECRAPRAADRLI